MKTYTVQSGDTLSSIAGEIYGNAGLWKIIFEANRNILSDPNKIQVGQRLAIPPANTRPSSDTTTPTRSTTLRLGSQGAPVKTLQNNLVSLDYSLGVDGIFGPATDRAVRHLQRTYGLAADGLVGPQTQKLISNLVSGKPQKRASARDYASAYSPDTRSNDTYALQRDLLALGFILSLTGYLDDETLAALHQFQEANGLDVSDDIDASLLDALHEQTSALEDDEDFDEDDDTSYYADDEDDEDSDDDSDDEESDDEDEDESDDEDEDESDDEDESEDEDSDDSDDEESEDDEDSGDSDDEESEDDEDSDDSDDEEESDEEGDESGDEGDESGDEGDDSGDEGGGEDDE